MSYILGAVALLIVSLVILQSDIFSKATAYVGIVMSLMMFVPPTAGTFGVYLSLLSLVPTVVWLILLVRRFFQLGQGVAPVA